MVTSYAAFLLTRLRRFWSTRLEIDVALWQFGDMCQVSHDTILLCPIVFDRCVWCPWGTQTEGVVFCLCKVLLFAFLGVQCLVGNVVLYYESGAPQILGLKQA